MAEPQPDRQQDHREQELRDWLAAAGLVVDKATYRIDEVATLLGLSLRTTYRMVNDGRIRAVPIEHADKTTFRIPRPFLFDLLHRPN